MRGLVPVLLVIGALAGCTDTPPSPDEPPLTSEQPVGITVKSDDQIAAEWAAEFAAARAAATSDFEREALADDVITPEEYDEAVQRYVACVNERLPDEFAGYRAVKNQYGFYGYQSPRIHDSRSAAWDAAHRSASETCRKGTVAVIEPLYTGMIVNPRRMTSDEQILDCLKRHGAVDESYTMANYLADLAASFGEEAVLGDYDPGQATGFDLDTDRTETCRLTPWV